jgi:hypothetical protein
MSFEKDQDETSLPVGDNKDQRAVNFLPKYFRTDTNKKFLNSTIDQMTTPGVVEKIDAFAGRRYSKATVATDSYLTDVSVDRENYQFEPVVVYKDDLDNVEFLKDYNDYIGIIKNFRGSTSNHSLLNSQEFYAWNPHIDWDKFTNFREYYWLPFGPQSIPVTGQSRDIVSTYTVTLEDDLGTPSYIFTPDGTSRNPSLNLYRGQTYKFDINTPGQPFAIAVLRTITDSDPSLGIEITQTSTLYKEGITSPSDYVEQGVIEFTVPDSAPDSLYYVSKNNVNVSGIFNIRDISENTEINVELEILGKKNYKTSNGIELSNGMKIFFQGSVIPEKYKLGKWYVEGVGSSIQLISELDLEVPSIFTSTTPVPFDNTGWDTLPFDDATSFAGEKDYILINRASADRNPWSRYNRWFHRDVIRQSAEINGQAMDLDQNARAKRPIIEFEAGLKLFQHGVRAKQNVDLVDDFTNDIFSIIEGSIGYNVDGIDLADGMRVLFTADTDILVNGKIYEIKFINHLGRRQITLLETFDSSPIEGETVLVLNGVDNKGQMLHYDGISWSKSQKKTSVNQSPMFDLFDKNGNNFVDNIEYPESTFKGNKIFSYKTGFGPIDPELGFPINYRSIANLGDIVFDFNLLSDTFKYQSLPQQTEIKNTDLGYIKKYNYQGNNFVYVNAWQKANSPSSQAVIRQYTVNNTQSFEIDVFDNSSTLSDLSVIVFLNSKRQQLNKDYVFENINNFKTVVFNKTLNNNDIVLLKCYSKADKNNQGFYEIPPNLEKNPINDNITSFTLGEVNDHVDSIIENLTDFEGTFPGETNLRDLGDVSKYGKKFIQHSGPLNLALFHLTDKNANIVKAIKYARKEYARFKRQFLTEAEKINTNDSVKDQVDTIIKNINKDRVKDQPFYFSDMIGYGGAAKNSFVVSQSGPRFVPLTTSFDLTALTERAVYVYVNEQLLVYEADYEFVDGFLNITKNLSEGDQVDVYEYESTNGSFIPQTPTKLGLYPSYEPKIYIDDTYKTSKKLIQGHDGSIFLAFDDYRDDLILELERRIFNNIKNKKKDKLFNIYNFLEGKFRKTGITSEKINAVMLSDFTQWLDQVGSPNFADSSFWDKDDPFTYNYSSMSSADGEPLKGFWRNVFNLYYDTDKPHLCPWEMLGFSIKPVWWEDTYGPAPYTSNNSILWQDLSEGLIKEPGKTPVRDNRFARPGLIDIIPVDESGKLVNPLTANIAQGFVLTKTNSAFEYGDSAPVETAWRKSSEYPFSLLTALLLLQPAQVFGLGFDTSRIERDLTGGLIYSPTSKRISNKDITFPCVCVVEELKLTLGLINYISNYLASYRITNEVSSNYLKYQKVLTGIDSQLAIKIGGFADKQKLKLVLDSRTPLNKGNVFIPERNYQIVFNKSSPLDTATFSGIIIEKTNNGFILRGYDKEDPVFVYNDFIEKSVDPSITVGGISESFVRWDSNQEYPIGTVVEYQNDFYRSKITHRSSESFEIDKFVKLPELPILGGATAIIRTQFTNETKRLPYGSSFSSIQEVVDFLVGYDVFLRLQGFKFDFFNKDIEALEDMQLCIKEFLFWTTQNWDVGTVLTVSPVANKVDFERKNLVVDDIYDTLNEYNLLASDGTKISQEFSNVFRNKSNQFTVKPLEAEEGIYLAKLPLVQKEHVVLIDNITEFNDVIYDKVPGYRQERIRVVGYRTANWNGGLNIPGFFYDDAKVSLWQSWKDYAIGDLVKYKEFFYSSNEKHTSSEVFDANKWNILQDKPESKLYPNWDYRTNQFADFYDLDSDNFDVEQQRLAQHLIGYQKRDYLANIIIDDVSQYKFYQGYIKDKGTLNSLTKLFDALSSADKNSLEFYEEWAIRIGQYGATDNIKEYEYILDESKFRMEPQPVELTDFVNNQRLDLVYEIPKFETYLKPNDYNHKPFNSIVDSKVFTKDSGYVRTQDIDIIVGTEDDILNIDSSTVQIGENIWVLNTNNTWTVYRNSRTNLKILRIQDSSTEFTAIFDSYVDLNVGEILGINTSDEIINGFYKITSVGIDSATFSKKEPPQAFSEIEDSNVRSVTKLIQRRFSNVADLNNKFYQFRDTTNERVWLDNYESDRWAVLDNKNIFSVQQEIVNPSQGETEFSVSYSVNKFNTVLVVGSPLAVNSDQSSGSVKVYTRPSEQSTFVLAQVININDATETFGKSTTISSDGTFIAVSATGSNKVFLYTKTDKGSYGLVAELINPQPAVINSFGSKIAFRTTSTTTRLFVNSPNENNGVIYVYDLIGDEWTLVSQITSIGDFSKIGLNYDINEFGDVLITTTLDGTEDSTQQKNVIIYRLNSENNWTLDQKLDYVSTLESFGNSIAINDLGTKIAVGAPRNDDQGTDNGCVYVYKQIDGRFVLSQTLFSPFTEFNEMFGNFVDFSANKLIIASKNGDLAFPLTLDNDTTTLDNNATRMLTTTKNVGKVYVYQEINDQYIYGEDLNKVNSSDFVFTNENGIFTTVEKLRFNSINNLLIANNHIYLGLPDAENLNGSFGVLIDCRSQPNSNSWSVTTEQTARVDIAQFKRCFIYSKSQNKILSDLDIVDPRQGKIPAPAEQEISFKTFYDPAIYSINLNNQTGVVVDSENAWSKEYVGKLWWNLSTSSWFNPYQSDTLYRSSAWNELIADSTIQVCEWVETDLLPKDWRLRADTPEGFARGISGQPLYDNDVYSERRFFDTLANRFTNKYYYWVVNSSIAPQMPMRLRSALEVAQLIASPQSLGYRFVSPLSDNSFALHNVKGLIEGKDSVLHFTLIDNINNENNIHSEYQLLTEGLESSRPNREIEQKWISSLIGYDLNNRPVPDNSLSLKERYGILNFPRQGMFVNRLEAVKQFVERANGVLIKNQIADNFNLSKLELVDEIPNKNLGLYDTESDSRSLLRFVSVAKVEPAELEPVIVDGKINSINIKNPGRGYQVPPSIKIDTKTGDGALIALEIDSIGKIVSAVVKKSGKNYAVTDTISVRKFSVLIKNDEMLQGKWSIVEWSSSSQQFNTTSSQSFDTKNYWNYVNWFANGYTDLSLIDFTIDRSFELFGLNDQIGDIIKINTIGTGGWLLLEKIDNQETEDYSVNYKVVGRENGTIQLSSLLYSYNTELSGYDISLYDTISYDEEPIQELRNIIEALRDDILIADLAVEWNNLFFAGVRYALSEQPYVDWIFKTSFVKAIHNLGNLNQKVTFQNDNLESYELYVNEVKPYSTKIREYISNYSSIDNTQSMITDFDLPPSYDPITKEIEVSNAIFDNGEITNIRPRYQNFPYRNWVENVGFDLVNIEVVDGGNGYLETPRVIISGDNGATAKTYLAKGRVHTIEITNPGNIFLSTPEIIIEGALAENGTPARAIAVIGNSLIRTPHITIKFDRVGITSVFDSLETVEEFVGTGAQETFILKWPMDTNSNRYSVFVDGIIQLSSEITVGNVVDTSKGYARELGFIKFNADPAINANIRIEYNKNVDLLFAVDRINFFYNPTEGMPGKELAQLMDGVEYGGVSVNSFGFGTDQGWDVAGWGGQWDTFNVDGDGNFIPSDDSFDTALTGGEFTVLNASGTEAGEIVVDGDGFVTSTTSKGPEELVPGQLGDILDMKIYHRVSEGAALITSSNYVLDGNTTQFNLTHLPITSDSLIVKINNEILKDTDYTVDYNTNVLSLISAGTNGDKLSVITTSVNGIGLIDFKSFVYDDSTTSIITSVQWQENYFSLITANGKVLKINVDYTIEQSTDLDSVPNRIKIVFNSLSLTDGDLIQYAIYDSEVQTYSQMLIDNTFNSDGSRVYHTFDGVEYPIPFNKQPISHNLLVKVGNTILNPGYSTRFITTISRDYPIEKWQFDDTTRIRQSEILLFANGTQVAQENFYFDSTGAFVRLLRNDIAPAGSELEIYVLTDADYFSTDTKISLDIDLSQTFSSGDSLIFEAADSTQLIFTIKEVTTNYVIVETFNREILELYLIDPQFKINNINATVSSVSYVLGEGITFKFPPAQDEIVSIYQFSNHDVNDFARKTYDVINNTQINSTSPEYLTRNLLAEGIIDLQNESISAEYVWIIKNGNLLSPNVDYVLENSTRIKLATRPIQTDNFDILQFRNPISVLPNFGYRLFKDIIGRTHFKRLNQDKSYVLSEPLNYYDIRIKLEDATGIEKPNRRKNIPGVLFIEGERIEYFEIKGNTLLQLRRGTLGTSIKEVYDTGTRLFGQGIGETVKYRDQALTRKEIANGNTTQFDLGFDISALLENYTLFTGRSNVEPVDFVEVFVGGRKLRKKSIQQFDATKNQDSPEADITLDPEFEIDLSNNTVVVSQAPASGIKVEIVRKVGKIWNDPGKSLAASQNEISKFLRGATIELPK